MVVTGEPVEISSSSAILSGKVTNHGGSAIISRGVFWGLEQNPEATGNQVSIGSGLGSFDYLLEGLEPNKTYHVVAFATNSSGTSFGEVKTFQTLAELPEVFTGEAINITSNAATVAGKVTYDGHAPIIDRGIYWSKNPDPVNYGNKLQIGNGPGTFSATLSGLSPNTEYSIVAYATNLQGTSYGEIREFLTLTDLPIVSTAEPDEINSNSALLGGRVSYAGGAEVFERGFIWGLNPDPTQGGQNVNMGSGIGPYSITVEGLLPNTTYYTIAYATNAEGRAYGTVKPFTTLVAYPKVSTYEPENITHSSALVSGEVINQGGSRVFERGIFLGERTDPTENGNKIILGEGFGLFSDALTGLQPNTTYYIVAFATNVRGTGYGLTLSFTTNEKPENVSIPNAFMPLSHIEANKTFKPNFGITPSNYSLAIFNRWGSKIFESNEIETGWDGKSANGDAPTGSYFYRIYFLDEEGKENEHRGALTLIR
ncbi:MAG: gliding motility-associated C-terminal domain-containing protein [Bacteroidales bacterium]